MMIVLSPHDVNNSSWEKDGSCEGCIWSLFCIVFTVYLPSRDGAASSPSSADRPLTILAPEGVLPPY